MSPHHQATATKPIPTEQWIAWMIGFITLTGTIVVFFYVNFISRTHFEEYKQGQSLLSQSLEKRLERMEDKLDQLLTNSKKSP